MNGFAWTSRAVVAAFVLLWPSLPAGAFICPDPAGQRAEILAAFQQISRAKAAYVVVHGTVTATGPRRERKGVETLPMRITGRQLGASGFDRAVKVGFQRRVICADHPAGCPIGYAGEEGDVLVFLRREGPGLVLEPQPCGGTWFSPVDTRLLSAIAACHRGGACE